MTSESQDRPIHSQPVRSSFSGANGSSRRIAGSFRDPSGYVFHREGRILRAVDGACHQILRQLDARGLFGKLIDQQLMVGTRFLEEGDLHAALAKEHAGFVHFLDHDPIAPLTFPYEWSFSMLADAALHTLKLQMELVRAGFALKDATAYNIQFIHGRPTFIDISSIERPARLDVWFALGQFAQMFTFPILLYFYRGFDFRSYFLGNINGRGVEEVARAFGSLEKWTPRALFDVTLPLIFHRRANASSQSGRPALEKENKNFKPQLLNLERLSRKISKLSRQYKPSGVWADYTTTCSYDGQSEQAKKEIVGRFLEAARPRAVLDMGCNSGDYSYLAAEGGATVVAADADQDAVEVLYRRLRKNPAKITPMVVDLSNPSPSIGFRNQERPGFFERLDVDCVLALALLHHLHVSGNLPLPAIRDLFYDMTRDHLILEFVPREDVMFKKLLQFRVDLYQGTTLDACRKVFLERFVLVREEPIPNSPRTLFLFQKRT